MSTRPRSASLFAALLGTMVPAGCDGPMEDPGLPRHPLEASRPESEVPGDGCDDGDPRQERHGTDCGCCHDDFGLAGSVLDGSGIRRVRIEDSTGFVLDIAVNPYGNFFRHVELVPPLRARVFLDNGEERAMVGDAHGNCNGCHRAGSLGLLGAGEGVDKEDGGFAGR